LELTFGIDIWDRSKEKGAESERVTRVNSYEKRGESRKGGWIKGGIVDTKGAVGTNVALWIQW
jgi:hypothetical protein